MMERLKSHLRQFAPEGIALAFSGGVDSTLLLAVLKGLRDESDFPLLAVFFRSVLQTAEERAAAERIAGEVGVELVVLDFDPLGIPGVAGNPVDRCYLCKKHIFGRLFELAEGKGLKTVMDGTNGDDAQVYRPGRRALAAFGVVSPLEALGIGKAEVRAMAKNLNLAVASKPSAPCLATRFPYGTQITEEGIRRVTQGEKAVRDILGSGRGVRLRVHGALGRLEVEPSVLPSALEHRAELVAALKPLGFDYVALDLEGFRSGSMDVGLGFKTPSGASPA
jgi:uncharacterized protein